MAAMPAHGVEGRGAPVLFKHKWLAPSCIPTCEIASPHDLISINVLKDDRRSLRFYVPSTIVAASTVIEHDNHGEATLVIFRVVMMPATAVVSGVMSGSAPLVVIVRVIIPIVLVIIAVCPIVLIRPVSIPIVPIRPIMVAVISSIIAIRSTIVVCSMARVAATVIRSMSGVALAV
jgi:hypothetical protein